MEDIDEVLCDENGYIDAKFRGWTEVQIEILQRTPDLIISIDLSSNLLNYLPDQIGDLSNLKCLNCSCNNLMILPNTIENLKKLQTLKANGNKLQFLPVNIGDCSSLVNLYLNENVLESIPDELSHCRKLQILKIQNNALSYLSPKLALLKETMQEMDVSNNPNLSMIPEKIRRNTVLIMWVLQYHEIKLNEISRIKLKNRDDIMSRSSIMTDIFEKQQEIDLLNEKMHILLTERQQSKRYLTGKSAASKFICEINIFWVTCKSLFKIKSSQVVSPS